METKYFAGNYTVEITQEGVCAYNEWCCLSAKKEEIFFRWKKAYISNKKGNNAHQIYITAQACDPVLFAEFYKALKKAYKASKMGM